MSARQNNVWIICLAVAIMMADGFDLQAIGFIAPDIARTWSLPISDFGVVLAAALAGSIPGAALSGSIVRRIGLRSTLVFALALFGVATLAALCATQLHTLAALRFVAGTGLGMAVPATLHVATDHSPARMRASLQTLVLCGQPIGAILGSALCGRLIPIYGWQFAFILGGIAPLLLIPAVLALLGQRVAAKSGTLGEPSTPAPLASSNLLAADLRPTTALIWASTFLGSFSINVIVSWLPSAMRNGGSTLQASILAISLFNFGAIFGALAAAPLIDRYSARKVMPILFGVAAVSMAALSLSRSDPSIYLAAALSGLTGYGGAVLLGPLATSSYPPQLCTMGVGWMLSVGRVGGALGPLAAGLAVGAGLAIGRLFWFTAAAALLVMLCVLALTRMHAPRTAAAPGGIGSA